MHPAVEEYMKREDSANQRPRSANCEKILSEVSEEFGMTYDELRSLVLDHTNLIGNG